MARQIPATPRFWRESALPFAESRSAADSRACYRPHTHATFSIGVVDAGRSVFTSQGHSVPLAPGMLVAVPAGCVHACNPAPGERWSYQMLHLEAAWMADTTWPMPERHRRHKPPSWCRHDPPMPRFAR